MEEKQTGELAGAGDIPKAKKKKPKSKKKKFLIALILMLIAVLAVAAYLYYRGTVYYQTHFFPNTNINGMDCGDMEAAPVIDALEACIDGYALAVLGRDYKTGETDVVLGVIGPEDIGLSYMGTREAVETLLQQQNEFMWIEAYLDGRYVYSLEQGISFDEELLESIVKSWDACKKKNMRRSEDAYISEYSDELGGYEIIPETIGTEIDLENAFSLIAEAVKAQEASVDLEKLGCYQEATVKSDDKQLNRIVNTANRWLGTKVVYDWNGNRVVVDKEILKEWVSIEDKKVLLDEEAVDAFVKEQAAAYDTYGRRKNFVTTYGYEISLLPFCLALTLYNGSFSILLPWYISSVSSLISPATSVFHP